MANSMHIISQIQGKEKNSICVIGCGSMLYNTPDFEACLKLINEGIDLSPFMTHSMPVEEGGRALELLKTRSENVVNVTLTLD